eukprot:1157889-Pelagomonas_calceolata.AAC.5
MKQPRRQASLGGDQRRYDAVFVHSISGRSAHLYPTNIPPQDRDIHLVGFKVCPDTNSSPTLEAATTQHASTTTRLKSRSSRNPNRNNKVTLHIILVGVAGTIYNDYIIKPLINLGLTRQRGISRAGFADRTAEESKKEESGRPGAWQPTLQVPISSVSGFLLG